MFRNAWVILGISVLMSASPAPALDAVQEQKLVPDDGEALDQFGRVAMDGDTAVIGTPGDDNFAGSAYVYTRSDGVWTEQAKLVANDGTHHDFFGTSVAVDGDTAVIGALGDDGTAGSAYVFFRTGNVWTQQAKFLNEDGAAGDHFGIGVAVNEDTAVVGTHGDDDTWEDSGSAYVFVRSGDLWTQQMKLHADDAELFDFFGTSVAVEGDTAVIGARGGPGFFIGSGYVFVRSGDAWTQQAKLLADDGWTGDSFGQWVALDGNSALIGSTRSDAYVFTRSGDVWTQQAKLLADDGEPGDLGPVALDGNTAVIGAPGSAYAFARSGEVWTQRAKLLSDDGVEIGASVAVDGYSALAGAPGDDVNGEKSGSAYAFRLISPVAIDAKPGSYPNSVNPASRGVIPVSILGSDTVDVEDIDVSSLRFGPDGAAIAHWSGHLQDTNFDGYTDLVTHYRTQATGIACGDESVTLSGEMISGQPIGGSDSIDTTGCHTPRWTVIWMTDQRRNNRVRSGGFVNIDGR